MRLLEYDARQFFNDCKYDSVKKQRNIKLGFRFGQQECQKLDTWLNSNSYTDQDFIKEVYNLNAKLNLMTGIELLDTLSRFLCGYDKQVEARNEAERLKIPKDSLQNFFLNRRDLVDVTEKELSEKRDFILETLNS